MNLPNKLTMLRVILIPFMMFFYLASFVPYGKLVALTIFVIAAYTDMLDGQIARKRNLITNLGKFLDPIADKLLTTSALIMIICDGTIPPLCGVISLTIILGREFMVAAMRQMAAVNGTVVAADKLGKLKTVSQMAAIIGFLLLSFLKTELALGGVLELVIFWTSMSVFIISVILAVVSGINYIVRNKSVFKD